MTKEYITFKEYSYLMNRIAYWLVKQKKENKITYKTDNTYSIGNREADLGTIEKELLNRGTNYQTDKLMNEYVEVTIHINRPNKDYLPNYVTGSDGTKYDKTVFINMANYVSKYEVDHNGISPEEVPIDNTPIAEEKPAAKDCNGPWTQSPLLLKQKPGSLGQVTSYSCGPHSLMQAFYNLTGIDVAESTIMAWAGTTTSGTGHQGLNTAVAQFNKKYNQNIKIQWKNLSDFGNTINEQFRNIAKLICEGKFIFYHILYRNQYGHYETYKTCYQSAPMFDIANSLGSRNGNGYNGYIENRSFTVQRQYIGGISQPSVAILWK